LLSPASAHPSHAPSHPKVLLAPNPTASVSQDQKNVRNTLCK
jgi:hypothetical protein